MMRYCSTYHSGSMPHDGEVREMSELGLYTREGRP